MRLNYKILGSYIRNVDVRNEGLDISFLRGISSIYKSFMVSRANTVGVDFSDYKTVANGQFAFNPNTARMGDKIPIALNEGDTCIVSKIYPVFEIVDTKELLPEYLMMWFRRPEFDRYARFKSHGSAREIFDWQEMCDVELPVPSPEKQREIVKENNKILHQIKLNELLYQKLEETAQAIYKRWFVDFEFPISAECSTAIGRSELKGLPYKSSGGEMVYSESLKHEIPKGWGDRTLLELTSKIGSGATPRGGKESYSKKGIPLIRSMNVLDYAFEYNGLAFIDECQAGKLDNVVLQEGDILINITGVSVARCCIVPSSLLPARVNQHVMIIRLKKELNLLHYLLCLLCSTDYKQKLLGTSESGSTRQALTKSEIETLSILLPSKDVRNMFEEKTTAIFSFMDNLIRQNYTLTQIFDNLLSMMATSKFDI